MNYIDVRGMFLGTGFTLMLDVYMIAWRAVSQSIGEQRRLLQLVMEKFVIPVFCAINAVYDVVVLFTDYFSHRFTTFIPLFFLLNFLLRICHASHHREEAAKRTGDTKLSFNRMARWCLIAGVLLIIGVFCKVVDDTKVVCFSSLRSSPFQLTGLFHLLLGVSYGLSAAAQVEWLRLRSFD